MKTKLANNKRKFLSIIMFIKKNPDAESNRIQREDEKTLVNIHVSFF